MFPSMGLTCFWCFYWCLVFTTETMMQDKLTRYEEHLEDLERQGIVYKPMIFTAYGRRHPSATCSTMHPRPWLGTEGTRQRHWQRQLAVEIWRRAAHMVKACLPWRPCEDGGGETEVEDWQYSGARFGDAIEHTPFQCAYGGAIEHAFFQCVAFSFWH